MSIIILNPGNQLSNQIQNTLHYHSSMFELLVGDILHFWYGTFVVYIFWCTIIFTDKNI